MEECFGFHFSLAGSAGQLTIPGVVDEILGQLDVAHGADEVALTTLAEQHMPKVEPSANQGVQRYDDRRSTEGEKVALLSKNSPLAEEARERLLSRVDTMRKSTPSQPSKAATAVAVDKRFTDFSTLPGYDELRLQRSIGDKFGLENPYFRMHDGRAGAVTEIGGRTFH